MKTAEAFFVLAVMLLVLLPGCEVADRRVCVAEPEQSAQKAPGGSGDVQKAISFWIDNVLYADVDGPVVTAAELYRMAGMLPDDPKKAVCHWGIPLEDRACQCLSEPELEFFIRVGPAAYPQLARLLHSVRQTRWTYMHPFSSSSLLLRRQLRIGTIAAYIVEAIRRDEKFFSLYATIQLEGGAPTTAAGELFAIEQAADEYYRWIEECYDDETQSIVCGDENVPNVEWDWVSSQAEDESANELGVKSGTVLQIVCDIPEEVGPVARTYPGRIDWPGGSESFEFELSEETFEVTLNDFGAGDGPVRVFFTVDDDPPCPTKFERGEWFCRGNSPRTDSSGVSMLSMRLSRFRDAHRRSQMMMP